MWILSRSEAGIYLLRGSNYRSRLLHLDVEQSANQLARNEKVRNLTIIRAGCHFAIFAAEIELHIQRMLPLTDQSLHTLFEQGTQKCAN
jgi:hypothetical protein